MALGTLALALVLPRLALGQGLRSPAARITLAVIAPPHLRAGASAARRSQSVADVSVRLPVATFDVARIDAKLGHSPDSGSALYLRATDGAFVPLTAEWTPVTPAATASFRVVTLGGALLPAGTWRVRFRLSPRDPAYSSLDVPGEIVVPALR